MKNNTFVEKYGTAVIIEKPTNKYLLQYRDNKPTITFPGTWSLFGGHIEAGQLPEDNIISEIEEELGIIHLRPRFLWVFSRLRESNLMVHRWIYYLNLPHLTEVNLGEGQGMATFTMDAIRKLHQEGQLFPDTLAIIEKYRSEYNSPAVSSS